MTRHINIISPHSSFYFQYNYFSQSLFITIHFCFGKRRQSSIFTCSKLINLTGPNKPEGRGVHVAAENKRFAP